jgi:histidinol-phosphate aminotransferase
MERFLRQSLIGDSNRFCNYAVREPVACDLSLVSGPFVWHEELARATQDLDPTLLNHYPLPNQDQELLEILSGQEGVSRESILLTSGADSAIEAVLFRFLEAGHKFGILSPNFPRFAIVAATIPGLETVKFTTLDQLPPGCRLVSVCTPNNPSTEEITEKDLRRLIENHPDSLICIDGVFDWYGSYSLSSLVRDYSNVILLKSFSKIGLAGLRLGYVIASPQIIEDLQVGLSPFAVPALIQRIGLEVARSFSKVDDLKALTETEFQVIQKSLGQAVIRSTPVPFYLLKSAIGSAKAAELLENEGIAVVDCAHCLDIPPGHLRVSIGDRKQNLQFLEAVDRLGVVG